VLSYPMYRLSGIIATRMTKELEVLSTIKLIAGIVLQPIGWIVSSLIIGLLTTWQAGVIVLVLAPLFGFIALRWSERWRAVREATAASWLRLTQPDLTTQLLERRRDLGEQILDLEALAHHKGSSFGSIGEAPQPSVEQFENDLAEAVMQLDPARRVWVENESRSIGRVFIPEGFWKIMKNAPLYNVSVPESARIDNLLADYTACDKDELIAAFRRIEKKLGGQHLKAALEALEADDFTTAATIALRYYDKTYQHCLDQNISPDIRQFDFETGDAGEIARRLRGE